MLPSDHAERIQRVRLSLDGLSLGDSFGQRFFAREAWSRTPNARELPPAPWRYTDDTEMALGIAQVLQCHGHIDQDKLAVEFARRFQAAPSRGYGPGTIAILMEMQNDPTPDWRLISRSVFGGQGSFGNGGAMRAAPVGAYFAANWQEVVAQATLSAEVTHAHPDGIAGAIAVAVAAAWATRGHESGSHDIRELWDVVLAHSPTGPTRDGILQVREYPLDTWEFTVAERVGCGERIRSADTVPFCLWTIARHVTDFCEGLWTAARVGGDMDTTCAIIGGVLALAVGFDGIPEPWRQCREALEH